MYKKGLNKKDKINFKNSDVATWETNICNKHSASRNHDNQTMKYFGKLIECNVRNIFPEKSYTKCGEETIRRPFPQKSILDISLSKSP